MELMGIADGSKSGKATARFLRCCTTGARIGRGAAAKQFVRAREGLVDALMGASEEFSVTSTIMKEDYLAVQPMQLLPPPSTPLSTSSSKTPQPSVDDLAVVPQRGREIQHSSRTLESNVVLPSVPAASENFTADAVDEMSCKGDSSAGNVDATDVGGNKEEGSDEEDLDGKEWTAEDEAYSEAMSRADLEAKYLQARGDDSDELANVRDEDNQRISSNESIEVNTLAPEDGNTTSRGKRRGSSTPQKGSRKSGKRERKPMLSNGTESGWSKDQVEVFRPDAGDDPRPTLSEKKNFKWHCAGTGSR